MSDRSIPCKASGSDRRAQCKSNRVLLFFVGLFVLIAVAIAIMLAVVLTRADDKGDSLPKRVLILTKEERSRLEEQLKIDEGVKYAVYSDTLGFLTFGIGHLITKNDPEYGKPDGTPVSEERVKEAFAADLETVLKDVYAWSSDCNTWPSEVKEIICNMMFNLGRNRMNGFTKLKAAVQARDWESAVDEMADSKWARQVKGRATRLIDRMRNVAH